MARPTALRTAAAAPLRLLRLLAGMVVAAQVRPLAAQAAVETPGGLAPLAIKPQLRLDVIAARSTAVHAGGGLSAALGTYVRLDLVGAAGPVIGEGSGVSGPAGGLGARVDGIARFLFDPYLQFRRGAYVGAGVSGRFDRRERGRALLVAVVGVEGARRRGVFPAAEVGIGGGVRIGGVLRWARADRR